MRAAKGVTIIELVVILVFLGVLLSFAAPAYFHSKRNAQDTMAQSQLRLVGDAEKMFRLQSRVYAPCGATVECNVALGLDLASAASMGGYWDYSVAVDGDTFCAQAVAPDSARKWHVTHEAIEPAAGGCP